MLPAEELGRVACAFCGDFHHWGGQSLPLRSGQAPAFFAKVGTSRPSFRDLLLKQGKTTLCFPPFRRVRERMGHPAPVESCCKCSRDYVSGSAVASPSKSVPI